jgi:hypothetical protein
MMLAEVPEVGAQETYRRVGEEHLSCVSSRADARGAMHIHADVAFVGNGRLACMQTHSDPHPAFRD